MTTIGTKLLKLRQKYKYSQSEIADILNVSQNAYNKWESDKCKPSVDNVLKLSSHYKIDIAGLLDDNEEKLNKSKSANSIINSIPVENKPVFTLVERLANMHEQMIKLIEDILIYNKK